MEILGHGFRKWDFARRHQQSIDFAEQDGKRSKALRPGARTLTCGLFLDRGRPRQEGCCHLCPRPFPAGIPPRPAAVCL